MKSEGPLATDHIRLFSAQAGRTLVRPRARFLAFPGGLAGAAGCAAAPAPARACGERPGAALAGGLAGVARAGAPLAAALPGSLPLRGAALPLAGVPLPAPLAAAPCGGTGTHVHYNPWHYPETMYGHVRACTASARQARPLHRAGARAWARTLIAPAALCSSASVQRSSSSGDTTCARTPLTPEGQHTPRAPRPRGGARRASAQGCARLARLLRPACCRLWTSAWPQAARRVGRLPGARLHQHPLAAPTCCTGSS